MAIKISNSTIIDDSRNIVSAGIATVSALNISTTEVISAARQLKNIASLDATTTATIETAIANAPNTFTDLNVTGIATFTNGPILVGTSVSTGTTSQRLQVTGGAYVSSNLGIGTTNPDKLLHIRGGSDNGIIVDSTTGFPAIWWAENGTRRWSATTNLNSDSAFVIRESNVADRLTILTGGNVGIGLINPTSKLHVSGDVLVSGVTTSATFDTGVIGSQTSGILTTTATTADQVLDSLPTATFQTARYQVSIACAGQLVTAGMTTAFTSVGAITAGAGYTETSYTNVALTGGSGNDARANIGLTTTGTVTSVIVVSPGSGYVAGNSLSATLGTVGSGFSFIVSNVVRNYQSTDVMIMQSVGSAATACDYIEYASLANSEILASFGADISGANARLLVTPTYRNNTLKVIRSGITV